MVTGANGFIGRNLVAHLVGAGWTVLAVDKVPCEGVAAESVVLDVRVPGGLVPFLDGETALFHLAACADIRFSVQHPREDFDNNVGGLFEALEAARQRGSRVLFASTASVFSADNPLPWMETGLLRPMSPYAAGKLAGEAYCYAYHRCYGVDVRVARPVATLMGHPGITLAPTGRSFPGDTLRWYADISKIRELGFEPRILLEEGVRRTIEWLLRDGDPGGGRRP